MQLFKKKIGKFKCPRCRTQQWFETIEALVEAKDMDFCIECFLPLKLTVEVDQVKAVERLTNVSYPGEQPITDEDYFLLKKSVDSYKGIVKGLTMMAEGYNDIEAGKMLSGDHMGATYFNIKSRQKLEEINLDNPYLKPHVEQINALRERFPRQVQRYLDEKLE